MKKSYQVICINLIGIYFFSILINFFFTKFMGNRSTQYTIGITFISKHDYNPIQHIFYSVDGKFINKNQCQLITLRKTDNIEVYEYVLPHELSFEKIRIDFHEDVKVKNIFFKGDGDIRSWHPIEVFLLFRTNESLELKNKDTYLIAKYLKEDPYMISSIDISQYIKSLTWSINTEYSLLSASIACILLNFLFRKKI